MDAVTALARRLLRIIAIALTLPPDFFLPQFDKPLAFLRPLHYSPQVSIPEEVTDWPVLLPGDAYRAVVSLLCILLRSCYSLLLVSAHDCD